MVNTVIIDGREKRRNSDYILNDCFIISLYEETET